MSERRWGQPYEQDGWTFYARRVAVSPDRTFVVVGGRRYWALEADVAERQAEEGKKLLDALGEVMGDE